MLDGLLLRGDARWYWTHAIPAGRRGLHGERRVSVTFRGQGLSGRRPPAFGAPANPKYTF